jgi:hypothetical protein
MLCLLHSIALPAQGLAQLKRLSPLLLIAVHAVLCWERCA